MTFPFNLTLTLVKSGHLSLDSKCHSHLIFTFLSKNFSNIKLQTIGGLNICNIFGVFYLKYWKTLLEEISEEERNA
jgi:hypothetical protein